MTTQTDLAAAPATAVSFAADLARHGERIAVHHDNGSLSYAELAARVESTVRSLGPVRRLVALEAENSLPSLVAYLAALSAGHPLLVLPAGGGEAAAALIEAYDPDVVISTAGDASLLQERREGTGHLLHPELALLLSTSGSTGSPKLVRLSAAGIQANAQAIAEYLDLLPGDVAATTLPLYYCYGMSVVNSHLLVGAALALTTTSVVDPCFWELMHARKATSFAAVPYTFELLERVGFADMDLPSLRHITQAGGRLAPDKVRSYAQLGRSRGWKLFVMYGQTEATARMAYLPPELAEAHPGSIGVPIPGGAFHLEPVPGLDDRELVYTGPNVMLGYAGSPADLAAGRTVERLHTGDLARLTPEGLYEITGRRSRFVKIVGLRVDLGQVERKLTELGVSAAVAGTDEVIVAAVEGEHDLPMLTGILAREIGIPRGAVALHQVPELPRLANGKPDYPAVLALGGTSAEGGSLRPGANPPAPGGAAAGPDSIRAALGDALGDALGRREIDGADTFVSLGGDSLSFVAASVRLEKLLGTLPAGWHLIPVADLEALAGGPRQEQTGNRALRVLRRMVPPMDTGVVVRAIAIVFIVSSHIDLFEWQGTAHVLMGLAGFNFARFMLAGTRRERLRRQLRAVVRIVVPTMAVVALGLVVTQKYNWTNLFLLNSFLGTRKFGTNEHFWFIEALVYILLGLAALLAIPAADRALRRWPWLFPMVLVGLDLLLRFDVIVLPRSWQGPMLWLFALGWAAAVSRTVWQRAAVSAVVLLSVPGLFPNEYRNATIMVGMLVVVWIATIPVPRFLHRAVSVLAGASLYIYVSHWLVFPLFNKQYPALAVATSLVVGIAYGALATRGMNLAERVLAGRPKDRP
ncbi:AMP-binding protein [Paeniglutamicibacter sp. R2-26]|uniref:AMP-binding protein n=1 Tax=Paeniglutamicibacter sp. R2-26 TaxID=3144417 RepID=UPI003EE809FF